MILLFMQFRFCYHSSCCRHVSYRKGGAVSGSLSEWAYTANMCCMHRMITVILLEDADHIFNIFSGDMTVFEELMEITVGWFADAL